jgi:hypothetical protein
MRMEYWGKRIPAILRRGRIRSDEEFYLLKEAADGSGCGLSEADVSLARRLVDAYEAGASSGNAKKSVGADRERWSARTSARFARSAGYALAGGRSTAALDAMRSVSVFILLTGLLGCSDRSDRVDVTYETLEAAIADGAVTRGWIPIWLPSSSVRIEESHVLDTNKSALRLTFSPSENWQPPTECGEVDLPAIPRAEGLENWPEDVPPRSIVPLNGCFGEQYWSVARDPGIADTPRPDSRPEADGYERPDYRIDCRIPAA